MRVLVLGATGHIGRRLVEMLQNSSWAVPVAASRSMVATFAGSETAQVNTRDAGALAKTLQGVDAVVNCVAGDARSISEGADSLVKAGLASGGPRIVHLSTMSVYGPVEGDVAEDVPLDPGLGWYGRAKCEAEAAVARYSDSGGGAVILRPGCVFGPGSELWVGRVGRWLQTGRVGDLGIAGDGWSNLVHVDDVCRAAMGALQMPLQKGELPAFNLAAPDSPRWNDYFVDLALPLHAVPVQRITRRQLHLDAWLAGPPLTLAQRALRMIGKKQAFLPDPIPPGLLRLWAQHIRLNSSAASRKLGLRWTPYAEGIESSANWFLSKQRRRPNTVDRQVCAH